MLHLVVYENRISSCLVRFQQRGLTLISLVQFILHLFLILKNLKNLRILGILRFLEFFTLSSNVVDCQLLRGHRPA